VSEAQPNYARYDDWTRGYRKAWFHFRRGLAWMLLEYAFRVMSEDDPTRQQLARAIIAASVFEDRQRYP
jgi:hypothetical protein